MGFHDAEPQPGLTPVGDPAQEIRDSFQAVLDALDAARADLHNGRAAHRDRRRHAPFHHPATAG